MANEAVVTRTLRELRCQSCGRKLAEYRLLAGRIEIKCPSCNTITVRAEGKTGDNPLLFQNAAVE